MERKIIDPTNILLTFLIGVSAILFIIGSIASFELNQDKAITLAVTTIAGYVIIILFLLKPKIVHEKPHKIEKIIEKHTIKEIEKIVEKPVIKKIIIEKPEKKMPKYVGSTETERFHKNDCRFSKLIKDKYKVSEDDKKYFTLRGFKACKSCKP